MSRILPIISLLLAFAPVGLACEMSLDQRAQNVSDYIESGEACLIDPPGRFRFDAALEQGFFDAINRERTQRGLTPLELRAEIQPAARFHSLDMGVNDFFDHESPDGRTHYERITAFDRTLLAKSSSENIAQFGAAKCYNQDQVEVSCELASGFILPSGTLVLQDLHQKLMNSPYHRDNILDPDKTHVAIGVARTDFGFNVTQAFVEYSGELSAPLPVQLIADEPLELSPQIDGWEFTDFAIAVDGEKHEFDKGKIPSGFTGTVELNARAETVEMHKKAGYTRKLVTWIYLSGPQFEILAPTEN